MSQKKLDQQETCENELIFPLLNKNDMNTLPNENNPMDPKNAKEEELEDEKEWGSRETLIYEEARQQKATYFWTNGLSIKFEQGSAKGSMFTLTSAILGAGILSLPYAMKQVGLVLGSIFFIGCACMCYFSLHLLVVCSRIVNVMSYEGIALQAGGPFLSKFTQVLLCCNLFGTSVGYLVAAGNMIPVALQIILDNLQLSQVENLSKEYLSSSIQEEMPWKSWIVQPSIVQCLLCLIFVLPLSLFRKLGASRYTALFAILCIFYLTLVVTIRGIVSFHSFHDVVLFDFTIGRILTAVPLIVFSFTCHPIILPVYAEMKRRSSQRMHKVMRRCLGIALTMYLCIGISVFLQFGKDTQPNFLNNDYHKDPFVLLGCTMFSIAITIVIPLFLHTLRAQLNEMIWKGMKTTRIQHVVLTVFLVGSMLGVATTTRNIASVLQILGATCNPLICYVCPSIFLYQLAPQEYKYQKLISILVACTILFISVASLIYQLYTFAK